MKNSPQFDLIRFLKEAGKRKIRFLMIGRWAVAQHGAPVVTSDYDFWVALKDRFQIFQLLSEIFDAELPPRSQWRKPIVTAFIGPDKVDLFSQKKIVNDEGQELAFQEVYRRSELKKIPEANISFRIPALEDLIAMKKFSRKDPLKQARNLEDIRYLLTLKQSR